MPFINLARFNQHTQSTHWAGWHRQLRLVGGSALVSLTKNTAVLITQLKKGGGEFKLTTLPGEDQFLFSQIGMEDIGWLWGFFFSLLNPKEGASSLRLLSLSFPSWIFLNTSGANCLCATVTWLVFISFHFPFLSFGSSPFTDLSDGM